MKTVRFLLPLLVLCACAAPSIAQPQLNFKRIVNNWPRIELYFSVGCNGTPAYFTDKNYFRVVENGVEIPQFDLWCPNPSTPSPISVALVLDASGNMGGGYNAGAKAFGNAFVDDMDGIVDQAAVVFFGTTAWLQQGMTTSQDLLHSSINALPANGGTALWDGVYLGVQETADNGTNPCRAVIVLGAGRDTRSTRSPSESISLANRNRVRVFTIGIGPWVDSAGLKSMAALTGGAYYSTSDGSGLVAILSDVMKLINTNFQECMISYDAQCMDGATRPVDLTLQNFCSGSDTKTKTYKALRDTSTFAPLRLRLGSVTARGNSDVAVPLELLDPIASPTPFYPAEFTVLFDDSRVTFKDLTAPPGTLLEGVHFTVTPIAGGITFESIDKKVVQTTQAPAPLALLTFTTGAAHASDTLLTPLQLENWQFSAGCFRPVCSPGSVRIYPAKPEMRCSVQAPDKLDWNTTLKDYTPNPFTITVTAANTGDIAATHARFTLVNDAASFQLVSPPDLTQSGTPATVPPGSSSQAQWELRALARGSGDSVTIRITASFDNHPGIECIRRVFIPAGEPALACSIQAQNVAVHPEHQRYEPMPFTVAATVRNTGSVATDNVTATIVLPPELTLAPPDTPGDVTKAIGTGVLFPAQFGNASWHLAAEPAASTGMYTVTVITRSSMTDSGFCTAQVTIPELGPLRPRLAMTRDTIDFGSVIPGNSSSGVLGLTNTGARTLHCSGATIGGTDAALFTFTAPLPDSLQAASSGAAPMMFSPATVGAKSAELHFATDDPARPAVTIVLIGRGQPAPRLTVDSIIDFGTVRSGDTRDTTLDLRNTGLGNLDLITQSIGGGDAAEFRIVIPAASTIAAGQFSRMTLRFLPSGSGRKTTSLLLVSNDTVHPVQSVTLTGNAELVGVQNPDALPSSPLLHANHPNPFSASTGIAFTLPAAAHARLAVVDALGREVALLHEGAAMAGTTALRFDAGALPEGLYFAVLRSGGRVQAMPMVKVQP